MAVTMTVTMISSISIKDSDIGADTVDDGDDEKMVKTL